MAEPGAWVPLSTFSRGDSLKSCDLKVPSLCPGLHLYIAGRQGGPLSGPESGLLSNTRKWIVQEDTRADRTRDSIGKGCLSGEKEGKGTQEDCSATWLTVSGFMVIGLVSRLSLANHSDSGSFLVVHASLSQGGFQRGGFWEVGRTCDVSCWPFACSSRSRWWWLVSSIFLTRTSCRKITHKWLLCCLAWVAVPVSASPNIYVVDLQPWVHVCVLSAFLIPPLGKLIGISGTTWSKHSPPFQTLPQTCSTLKPPRPSSLNGFLDMTPEAHAAKEKRDKFDFIKMENFGASKYTIKSKDSL